MTKAYNRRYFFEEIKSFYKSSSPFCIAMIDIDKFKKINDTYGHDIGDSVIISLANILKRDTKGGDLVARFGGEEFCVALRDVDKNQAIGFFAKLRKTISDFTLKVDKHSINFTVSVGLSFNDGSTIKEMIKQADEALFKAKENGRNRVEIV